MTVLPGGFVAVFYAGIGLVAVIIEIAGLLICLRYVRLSTSMPLLVLSFAGSAMVSIGYRVLQFAGGLAGLSPETHMTISMMLNGISIACEEALVLGLLLVFRDLRERFHFLREVHEGTRPRTAPAADESKPV